MKLPRPRIEPISNEQATDKQRAILAAASRGDAHLNMQRTIAQYPILPKARQAFTNHVIRETSLPPRERELLILCTCGNLPVGVRIRSTLALRTLGRLTDDEMRRVAPGPDAEGWSEFDAPLVRAADELHHDAFISDHTWNRLAARYNTEQLMDTVFAIGQYHLVSMALNTFGVQFEPDTTDRFPF